MPRSTILIPVIVVLVHPPVIRQRLPNSTMVSFSPCNTLLRRPKLRPADSKRESVVEHASFATALTGAT